MRSSAVLTAAFAGCALSSPLVKRDLVQEIDTVFDVVFTTAFETVTAGASPVAQVTSSTVVPSVESSATTSAPVEVKQNDFFNNRHSYTWAWATTVQSAATSAAAASPEAASSVVVSSVAPVSTSAPVIESTSVYVAPSTSFVTSSSAPASTSSAAEVSLSNSDSLNILKARAGTPTCNPNNVRYFKGYFPSPTAYCKRWQAASPSPTNIIAPDLTKKQTNNICSCVLAGTFVSNTPLTAIKVLSSCADFSLLIATFALFPYSIVTDFLPQHPRFTFLLPLSFEAVRRDLYSIFYALIPRPLTPIPSSTQALATFLGNLSGPPGLIANNSH